MTRLKICILIPLVASVIACRPSLGKMETTYLTAAIEKVVDGQYQWVVVLPGLGCHGCIQEAEMFMKEHITDQRILFVLTKISSLKIFQQNTEIQINEHPNIYIDKDNIFDFPTDNNIYPCVIQLKNGKLLKHSFQSPQNAAFNQLKNNFEIGE